MYRRGCICGVEASISGQVVTEETRERLQAIGAILPRVAYIALVYIDAKGAVGRQRIAVEGFSEEASSQAMTSSTMPRDCVPIEETTGLIMLGFESFSSIARRVALFPELFGPTITTISSGSSAK
jgi:hypothetical protein